MTDPNSNVFNATTYATDGYDDLETVREQIKADSDAEIPDLLNSHRKNLIDSDSLDRNADYLPTTTAE